MKEADVIIVGGGIGGLTCGALLAKNGLNTVILSFLITFSGVQD
jgi:phytoene dehydrogenase-like protein